MLEKIPKIELEKIKLKEDSILICYTDGLVELENSNGIPFGTKNLIRVVKQNFKLKMKKLDQKIFLKLNEFKGNLDMMDDTAIISCKFYV